MAIVTSSRLQTSRAGDEAAERLWSLRLSLKRRNREMVRFTMRCSIFAIGGSGSQAAKEKGPLRAFFSDSPETVTSDG